MSEAAGRTCPLRYRYGAQAIACHPSLAAETLYVVGGLYGNLQALDAIETMAAQEDGPVTLVFNGDFNWFNVDHAGFTSINRRILAHHAIAGNVEAELAVADAEVGCGCAYPEDVDNAVVERSNQIHARLKETASHHSTILERLSTLPMTGRFQVGDCRIGIVHGDADTLAGWRFSASALADAANRPWIVDTFRRANVDLFASSHTCLPALRRFDLGETSGIVINNGAAGMPNFTAQCYGLLSRISIRPPTDEALYGTAQCGVHVHALPIRYDHAAWERAFLANWPEGSPAWLSYYRRIMNGTEQTLCPALDA